MMKKSYILSFALAAMMMVGAMTGCSKKGGDVEEEFTFALGINGDFAQLEAGNRYQLDVFESGGKSDAIHEYSYSSNRPTVAAINATSGSIQAKSAGTVTFTVTEINADITQTLVIDVVPETSKAVGGYNFSSANDPATKGEILGKLEKYAMDTHLTGITLFENGGYVKYSDRTRAIMRTNKYIPGYGFGTLSDSTQGFTTALPNGDKNYPLHYQSASASDPGSINALDATGSQVSDLSSYITGSYFSMKMNDDASGTYWYSQFARGDIHDTVTGAGKHEIKMFHTGAANEGEMYTGWRIYVRTDASEIARGNSNGFKYNNKSGISELAKFDGRPVQLEDYEFIFRLLLTKDHNLSRGAELAADTSYGIRGGLAYNTETAGRSDAESLQIWNAKKASGALGIKTGTADGNETYHETTSKDTKYPAGDYIEFDLVNPIDSFTAMYTLSSSLYSPLPEEFIKTIGVKADGSTDGYELCRGAKSYGTYNNNNKYAKWLQANFLASTLCVGPYYLEKWEKDSRTVFTRNDQYWEYTQDSRYKVNGVVIGIYEGANSDPDLIYKLYEQGTVDSCGLPQKRVSQKNDPDVRETQGDSTFKLNVNSCTQEQWDYNFGPQGKISAGSTWNVKPWMSNDNFLKGLYWAINRKEFADNRGVRPSINYFSDSYLIDPKNNVSYNSTDDHVKAVKNYHNVVKGVDDYGYNKDTAINYFKTAVAQLVKQGKLQKGTYDNKTVINIEIWWMYPSDINEYGTDIARYFQSAFNDPKVSGETIELKVINNAVTVWDKVYEEHLMKGQFDLGFGAISGNTYDPLNFMEVLKSDNSSTFTLNWGADTSKVDAKFPLSYNGEKFSFDALWEVADHGGVVNEGVSVKPIVNLYKNSGSMPVTDLIGGAEIPVVIQYLNVQKVTLVTISVKIYVIGGLTFDDTYGVTWNKTTNKLVFDATAGAAIDTEIKRAFDTSLTDDEKKVSQFKLTTYNKYWWIELTYGITIDGGQQTQRTLVVASSKDTQNY